MHRAFRDDPAIASTPSARGSLAGIREINGDPRLLLNLSLRKMDAAARSQRAHFSSVRMVGAPVVLALLMIFGGGNSPYRPGGPPIPGYGP